ncbi:MAG: hypothetical protein GY909_06685 [Oligoflexia bacterium]|nr:hypothetical protein [Oligoflexia bacterium]
MYLIKILIFTILSASSFASKQHKCPKEYIPIQEKDSFFCVARYEMRNIKGKPTSTHEGLPEVYITRNMAKKKCQSLGKGYYLINSHEWDIIAHKINYHYKSFSAVPKGHSGSTPFFRLSGKSSYCYNKKKDHYYECFEKAKSRKIEISKHTHIYDFYGNVAEWVDSPLYDIKSSKLEEMVEYNFDHSNEKYYIDFYNDTVPIPIMRGGSYSNKILSEIHTPFYLEMVCRQSHRHLDVGYRCIYSEDKKRKVFNNSEVVTITLEKDLKIDNEHAQENQFAYQEKIYGKNVRQA